MTSSTAAPWFRVHPTPAAAGLAAGSDIAAELRAVLATQENARMIFASAPSQAETLETLAAAPDIDWSRVTAFHMDEYIGLDPAHPAGFANWLRTTFADHVDLGALNVLQTTGDVDIETRRYTDLLAAAPIDIVCLGIGINGHIAFNDPHVADFHDPASVKVVELDETSRRQQVQDGCFAAVEDVPRRALTLTIPRLLDASRLFCVATRLLKAEAVRATLLSPLSPEFPSTVLRSHPGCTLYVDDAAAQELRTALAVTAGGQ